MSRSGLPVLLYGCKMLTEVSGWRLPAVLMGKKKLFSEVPYIEGERLLIKRITQDDVGALGMIVDYLENDTDI